MRIGYHCMKLFEKGLEFFLPIVLRRLRQESPCRKTSSFHLVWQKTPCGCCLPACLPAGRVSGTDVSVMQSHCGDPQQYPRVCCQQRGNA